MQTPDFLTIKSVDRERLPYEQEELGERPILYFMCDGRPRPLVNIGMLDRLQDDLRAAPSFDETKPLGGPLHCYWERVTPTDAMNVLDRHQSKTASNARMLSKETNDIICQSECYVCGTSFSLATRDGTTLPYYGGIVSLAGRHLHDECAPTLADDLAPIWDNTDAVLPKFL